MRPRWWAGCVRTPSSKAKRCPVCGRAMKKNGRTGKGVRAVEMPGLPVELDDAAAAAQAGADAGGVPSWLLGPSSQRAADSAGDARALRKRIAWCWRIRPRIAPPDARRHTVMADARTWATLVPDHRHRRANRRGAGLAVVRARVQGRIPDPVLPASRAGRAHRRRAARRGGGVHAGVAGNEDPALPGARAAQHEDGPDVQAQAPGRPRAEEAVRRAHLGRDGRAGRQVGRGPQRMARTVEGLHRRTHLRARRPVQPQASRRRWWWTHEELRRCYRRLERLFREGRLFAYLEPELLKGGPVARTTNRLEGGVNSVARTYCATIAGCPRSTCAARANGYAT